MFIRKAFLLIELLIAITFFVLFVGGIAGLQFVSMKTKDLAIKRMQGLSVAANCLEALRAGCPPPKNKNARLEVERTALFAKVNVKGYGVSVVLSGPC